MGKIQKTRFQWAGNWTGRSNEIILRGQNIVFFFKEKAFSKVGN